MTAFTRSRSAKILAGVALLSASAIVVAGCSSTPSEEPSDGGGGGSTADLTLELGSLLPQTGSLSFLGPPMESGVGLAVKEVNDAAAGITINLTAEDEGDTDTKAYETSISKLQSAGVTAIVGAAASGVSRLILDGNVSAGILQISASNTGPDFTDWDDNGLYFRTAPSDLLQGEVLGNLIAEDGHKTLGVIYQNDAYGTGLFENIKSTFENAGGEVVADASYNVGDGQFDAQVETIKAQNPDAVAIVSFDQFKTIAPLLVNAGISPDKFYLVDGNLSDYGSSPDTNFPFSLEGAQGTKPGPALEDDFTDRLQAYWTGEGNPEVNDFTYAAEAYDAVVLVSLASLAAGSTEGADIAAKMAEVSGGTGDGEKCTSFADCAEIINGGGTADYDGYSGEITFDENGDPQGASIGTYVYDAENLISRTN
ncbi:ABC-type branched-subunit amino acid transport system substrate-binding protein [Microbacterium foliorum]|jgi:branched-chain amino acid transport system substrate-binding protein|uniref:ABC-type branched-subunit amino acid transport system substrate-binding protein n=1 Tax=Microbacterium foliorum TaxID=104336 RepID=A0ABU1HKT9_9MICO|nr:MULTISPECIES: ABC transporter substrate-binding protein [Microbacterium]AQY00823.1 amino acid ABC transporter substrate-binding protein [Microbacterium foliorum]KIP92716.1 amino acid ABC transporter substrate-binding protein [Microbacterium sp. MEJ108Y]KQR49229.1 amino acid ABC transporter substrate-binding protein [Microbacterium sp. Leaf161]MDR6140649.1 ABC-type branched-subunit amino acid transport system substrate-binding protein [Microbacterium foliorum]